MNSPYAYILLIAFFTYLLRVLPLTLIRKPMSSRFIRSFLHYVPFVTLAVMAFPAILTATGDIMAGAAALVTAMVLAFSGRSMVLVAACACLAAFAAGIIL